MSLRSTSPRRAVAALLLVPLLALTACGDDDDEEASTGDTTTDTTADTTTTAASDDTTATTGAPPEVPASVTLGVGETEYGEVLTEPGGKTLYLFDADADGEPTCVDAECTEKWPPLLAEAAVLPDGADSSIELGTVERPDGTSQVTVNGSPVYTMSEDRPGEALCQGGDEVWWIVGPDGEANRSLEPV